MRSPWLRPPRDGAAAAQRPAGPGRTSRRGAKTGPIIWKPYEAGADTLAPVHPGEVLREEFLVPLGLSAAALAQRIGVPPNRVSEIAAGHRAVTGDTALRLAAAFGTTAEFWMNQQKGWKLAVARDGFEAEIERVG